MEKIVKTLEVLKFLKKLDLEWTDDEILRLSQDECDAVEFVEVASQLAKSRPWARAMMKKFEHA